jgi:TRAP-type uncharacterized transport system substrate-binding protein
MKRTKSRVGWRISLTVVGVIFVVLGVYWIFISSPSQLIIATSVRGSGYEQFGQRYRQILARSQVDLIVRPTSGTFENFLLLNDPNSRVQAGIVQGGVSDRKASAQVISLGRIAYQPFFLFQRSDDNRTDTTDFRGQKLAIGPIASETRSVAVKIFGEEDASGSPLYSALSGVAALEELRKGKIDGAFIAVVEASSVLRSALADGSIKPMSFKRADALTRLFPFLVKITVPAGSIDYQNNIPVNEITTIGTTVALVARAELHPQLIGLLAQAAYETHNVGGFYQLAGEFPTTSDPEFEMSYLARDLYRNGPGYAAGYIPWWVTHHVQIVIALAVGVLAVIVPLVNFVPKIIRYAVRRRVISNYKRLDLIEARIKNASCDDLILLQQELEELYSDVLSVSIPTSVMDPLFGFKTHLNLVRMSIAVRLGELQALRHSTVEN